MKILLVFTFNTSLKIWHEQGILNRELKVYRDLVDNFGYKITLLTYGNKSDINILKEYELEDYFEILPIYSNTNKSNFKIINIFTSIKYTLKIYRNNNYFDIVKTNQLYGSWVAIFYKLLTKNKLIIRTGYNSVAFAKFENKSKIKILLFTLLSKISLIFCDLYVTTNKDDINLITKNKSLQKKIIYQPNFVDIAERDVKQIEQREFNTLFSVGRLEEQKNHTKLIEMLKNSKYKLRIVGEGKLRDTLIELSKKYNIELELSSNLDHDLLLETYSEYLFYIQLSKFEGNPKTILEAMGAGCVVITTNVYGIKNIIKHEENGILIKANDDLSLIIDNLLLDNGLINKISTNAKETVFDNFSYENYLSIEVKNYESLNIIN
jgi:glycosyltransferase involved in cell wall biosynthesis